MQRNTRNLFAIAALLGGALALAPGKPEINAAFEYRRIMTPMRDGVHLETVILRPVGRITPLPILLERTPYGVPDKAPIQSPAARNELTADGYIFVFQNLRSRFGSEGVFNLSSQVDLGDPRAVNETSDAYDTVAWLVENVPNNNGRVGITGVSMMASPRP